MKRSLVLLFIFIAVFTIGYTARGPLISQFFQWYLKGYCRTCLGSRLTYDKVRYEQGRWIFDAPVLTTQNRLEKGGYSCQAKKAIIDVSIFLSSHSLTLDVEIDSPHIDIGTGAEDIKSIIEKPCQTFRLFNVHMNMKVPQGTILVHDFNEEHLVPIPLFFNMDLNCREKKEGCASLWFGKAGIEKHDFLAVFSQVEVDKTQLSLDFYNVECFPLQQIFRGIWPELAVLQVTGGSLGGRLVFSFPKGSESYGEGQVILKDLNVDHPSTNLKIQVPSLKIDLASKQETASPLISFITNGKIEAEKASVIIKKGDDPFWLIENLSCNATFQTGDDIKFTLAGNVDSPLNRRQMNLKGYAGYTEDGKSNLSLNLDLIGKNNEEESTFHFSARELGEHWSFGEIEVSGFGREELKLIQYLTQNSISENTFSEWQELEIIRGSIDASAIAFLKGLKLSEVKIEQVTANGLEFGFLPWNLSGHVLKGTGSLSFDLFSDEPLKTLNAGIDIRNASLNLEGLDMVKWEFSNVYSHLRINQGVIQKSLLKGMIAGLNGEILIDGTTHGPFAKLTFKGKSADFAKALPDSLRKGVEKEFSLGTLQIFAEVEKLSEFLQFKGKIAISEGPQKSSEIDFGFALEKTPVGLWHRWPPHPVAADYFPNAGLEAVNIVAPSLASPINILYSHLIKQKIGFGAVGIKNGWFQGSNLALEKFLSPFLFRKDQMSLSGLGDFIAEFDGQKLVVHYDASQMVVENLDFCAEIPKISEKLSKDPLVAAVFVYDFDKNTCFNSFVIQNGSYLEKNTGLIFTEVNAKVSMENDTGHLSNVKAFCNGLYFEGEIDLDWSMPGDGIFDVSSTLQTMNGKASDLKVFLSHINKDIPLLKIPLGGNVSLQNTGAFLKFSFKGKDHDFQTKFQGRLTDGLISGENIDMCLSELSLNFEYDHAGNTLDFRDIQATLLVGKANHVEEYSVTGAKFTFTDYRNSEIEFDFCTSDKNRSLVRLAGCTTSELDLFGEPIVSFHFDKSLSHFGNVHPIIFDLALKDWSQINTFKLEFEFQLENLLSDLQRFSRTGLFFLSRNLLKELHEVSHAEGNFNGTIEYEKDRSIMRYYVNGSETKLGSHTFNKFLLSGTKKDSLWSIDQLQLDDISLACDILKSGSIWNINFFGARFGSSMMIGLEGKYHDDDNHLDAKINVLEANLSDISKWHTFQSLAPGQNIAGELHATGIVFVEFDKTLPFGMRIDAKMTGSLNNGSFKGFLLQDIKNMSFNYKSEVGFSMNEVFTGLKTSGAELKAHIFLKKASFDFNKHELSIESLAFDIPSSNLPWFSKHFQETFPTIFSKNVQQTVERLKDNEILQGVIDAKVAQGQSICSLKLNDGLYNIMGKEYDLKNLIFEYSPFFIRICGDYKHQSKLYKIDLRAMPPSFDVGEIVLSEVEKNVYDGAKMPLIVHWRNDLEAGFYIQKISGTVQGLNFDLGHMPDAALSKDAFSLSGKIDIDFNTASNLGDEKLRAAVQDLKIGSGYSLIGRWNVSKEDGLTPGERINFQGEMLGQNFEVMGYRLCNLYAQVFYGKDSLSFCNLKMNDFCGTLQTRQVDFINKAGAWIATSQQLVVNEFRPSVLSSFKPSNSHSLKSLVIRHMEINQLQGAVGDKNSFTGYGYLSFINPQKKNVQHPIFTIPVELLTRIGLDMAALTPIRGSIFYELKNGRASISKFKDVYSKGKLSKFNLANNGYDSYVDFDGNLHLQVRMKQNNLIFKLAELFTVTVQGTLKNPVYALQKQIAGDKSRK